MFIGEEMNIDPALIYENWHHTKILTVYGVVFEKTYQQWEHNWQNTEPKDRDLKNRPKRSVAYIGE